MKITKTCNLQEIINRISQLSDAINLFNYQLRVNNIQKSSKKDEFDYGNIEMLKEQYQEDIITIKLAVDKYNTVKQKRLIYERSELARELNHLNKLYYNFTDTSEEGLRKKFNIKDTVKKVINFFIYKDKKQADKDIKSLETKIANIDSKLAEFNKDKKVTIKVNLDW